MLLVMAGGGGGGAGLARSFLRAAAWEGRRGVAGGEGRGGGTGEGLVPVEETDRASRTKATISTGLPRALSRVHLTLPRLGAAENPQKHTKQRPGSLSLFSPSLRHPLPPHPLALSQEPHACTTSSALPHRQRRRVDFLLSFALRRPSLQPLLPSILFFYLSTGRSCAFSFCLSFFPFFRFFLPLSLPLSLIFSLFPMARALAACVWEARARACRRARFDEPRSSIERPGAAGTRCSTVIVRLRLFRGLALVPSRESTATFCPPSAARRLDTEARALRFYTDRSISFST